MKEQQKQYLIDMMKADEELGLYNETIATEEDAKIFVDTIENPPAPNEKLKRAFEKQPKQETLEEAAEKYGWRIKINTFSDKVKANELAESAQQDFIKGAKSDAARDYWFKIFKEQ
jgi:ABC-type metal ion transport system substrate-binding protein